MYRGVAPGIAAFDDHHPALRRRKDQRMLFNKYPSDKRKSVEEVCDAVVHAYYVFVDAL